MRWLTTPANIDLARVALDSGLESALRARIGERRMRKSPLVGGFVKQYQIDLDPNALLAYRHPTQRGRHAM